MRRALAAGVLGLLVLIPGGCIAVSAKEVSSGMRFEAVATPDGGTYVVDKAKLTARPVRTLVVIEANSAPRLVEYSRPEANSVSALIVFAY